MKKSKIFAVTSGILVVGALMIFAGQKNANSGASSCADQSAKPACVNSAGKSDVVYHDSAAPAKQATPQGTALPLKKIMFFMNPNGHPCQMQLAILDGMKDKLRGLATINYVKTTEASDQETFYKFGIRGLPSLIILDNSGNEIKRFTPGVQDEQTILSVLSVSGK